MIELVRELHDKKYSVLEIESINKLAMENPEELVRRSEEYYNNQVMKAARTVIDSGGKYKFILLCGPSASGKTTTAHKLKHRLIAQGVGSQVVSMDDFYRGMAFYPLREDGTPDMESVETLDMDLLNKCFYELMDKGEAMFPVFDFASQEQRLGDHKIALGENDILIMEGIHALNPMVLCDIPEENIYRIYVSVRTKFVDGDETLLVPKDIRLLRRMVRDSKFRNYPLVHTLEYWSHVVASERINIDLYRDDVDLKMDNTIDYEVCLWNKILHTAMENLDENIFEKYPQIEKITKMLMNFRELDHIHIPKNSLLREFIGD